MSQTDRGGESESAPRFLSVALVLGPWGAKGALRVKVLTDFPDRLRQRRQVFIDEQPYDIASMFPHKDGMIVTLVGVETKDQAEVFRGKLLDIPTEEAQPLPPDHFYWYQIVGLDVWTQQGSHLGVVKDILPLPSNDVYVVERGGRDLLIPAIKDVVIKIDLAARKIIIQPLPGLLPDDTTASS